MKLYLIYAFDLIVHKHLKRQIYRKFTEKNKQMTQTLSSKTIDLTKSPPRRPDEKLNGFVILGRTIDKCRALIAGKVGEYHYDCPVDKRLFTFKGINGDELKAKVVAGKSDQEIADWLLTVGTPHTSEEIKEWSHSIAQLRYYDNPNSRDWFIKACGPLGLDPKVATLFEYLIADDIATFKINSETKK